MTHAETHSEFPALVSWCDKPHSTKWLAILPIVGILIADVRLIRARLMALSLSLCFSGKLNNP